MSKRTHEMTFLSISSFQHILKLDRTFGYTHIQEFVLGAKTLTTKFDHSRIRNILKLN